jgi:hypothetical protein
LLLLPPLDFDRARLIPFRFVEVEQLKGLVDSEYKFMFLGIKYL